MERILLSTLFLGVFVGFCFAQQPGQCGATCVNDNQCVDQHCSYCDPSNSTCSRGLACGQVCRDDADCYPFPISCGNCAVRSFGANKTCGPPQEPVLEDPFFGNGGCNSTCQNNNQCNQTLSCSRCEFPAGVCAKGLSCGSLCKVDTDCDQTSGYCSLCRNRRCGSGNPTSAPEISSTPTPTPSPPAPTPYNLTKACIGGPEASNNECGPDDIVSVPENFSPQTCKEFAHNLGPKDGNGYDIFNLGCLSNSSYSIGERQQPPSPDCGWGSSSLYAKPTQGQSSYKGCTAQYKMPSISCIHIWDTIIVPNGWSADTCNSYVQDVYSQLAGGSPKPYYMLCTFPHDDTNPFSVSRVPGQVPSTDCGWQAVTEERRQAQQVDEEVEPMFVNWPSKLCVSLGQGSRQTLNVPGQWTADTCASWSKQFGAGRYQLGCIFNSTYSFGDAGGQGGAPSPNCGW